MANIERLKRLVEVLEAVKADPKKERDFDMSSWAEPVPSCGTHMCAVGWAANDPVLAAQGLQLADRRNYFNKIVYYPTFEDEQDFEAVALFFGITDRQSYNLFDPSEYNEDEDEDFNEHEIGIEVVIDRIREVITAAEHLP